MVEVEGVRGARPEDYDRIVALIDRWWGRPVSSSLPRLFLDHFWSTSRIAEDGQGLAGFLVAFVSPSQPLLAYVHFVGVRGPARPPQKRPGSPSLRGVRRPGTQTGLHRATCHHRRPQHRLDPLPPEPRLHGERAGAGLQRP
jgi:hypothetical protein